MEKDSDFVNQVGEAREHLYGRVLGERRVSDADQIARLGVAESLIRFRALPVEGPLLTVPGTDA